MGLNQSTHGTWNTNAICNLHLATGAICRPGSGPMSLTGQPNAMGGREMGYMGPGLPGQRSVASAADRDFVEKQWHLPTGTIRADTGPGTIAMFEQLAAGDIKACWIICTNPVASVPNRKTVIAGLEAVDGDEPLRRHRPARSTVGGGRRRDGQLRAQPHAVAGVHPARRTGPPGLAADLSGRHTAGLR
jgi:anaerobic selenocysteine-containing dehydrogenase